MHTKHIFQASEAFFPKVRQAARACGQRHFYGPLPFGSLWATKSDGLLVARRATDQPAWTRLALMADRIWHMVETIDHRRELEVTELDSPASIFQPQAR
jgi:hypothetical protein